ncbi:extracellular solute-binding protein [Galbitalea sp. SE-J8]|uniref:ABC transporter substrate-binding protein n=1 Tax=Galbitalea sp. SE-J8 TaxID=3054952 RepID=UPI00259CE0BF|nr:extracellular solute-binding protein [Galbitalea sp. SE-J8]MDM4762044.1 extracellular solute-binding protein [Galbitalea sp. SE-J8]
MATWMKATAGVAAIALATGLAACSSSTPAGDDESAATPQSLSFLLTDNGPEWSAAFKTIAAGFEKKTGITVNIEQFSSDDYDKTVETRLSAGADGPDFYLVRPASIPDYVAGGYLTPLDDQSWFTALEPAAQKAPNAVQDGSAYAFPIAKSGNHVVYNKDLFAKAGIEAPPLTLSELTDDAKKLLDAGVTPIAMSGKDSWWLQFILFHATAQQVLPNDPDNGAEIMAGDKTFSGDAGWESSVQLVKDLEPYYLPDPLGTSADAAKAAFLDGSAAMFPAPWVLPDVRTTDLNVGAFVFPTTENPKEPSMWGDFPYLFGVNPTPGHTKAAEEFAAYLFESDVYPQLLTGVAAFPVVDGVAAPDSDPIFAEAQAAYAGRTFYGSPNDTWLPGVGDVLTAQLQDLLAGKSSAKDVLSALDDAVADAQ